MAATTDSHPRPLLTVGRPGLAGIAVTIAAACGWLALGAMSPTSIGVGLLASLLGAVVISMVIWQACDPFADAAQFVGRRFRIPGSVRGATLDAIASSMPELYTGIFFVAVALTADASAPERLAASAEGYGSTIATCAGSSIYNMILIPAICAIAISFYRKRKPFIEVESQVLNRDGLWAIGAQFGLLVFLFLPNLHWWMALLAMIAYIGYVSHLMRDARRFRRESHAGIGSTGEDDSGGNGSEADDNGDEDARASFGFDAMSLRLDGLTCWVVLLVSTLVAASACYFLVELTIHTADMLDVDTFFVAVILAAAVSSIPDTFMSLGAAIRGDDSGAVSNAFGSNIFDICICMSIPLLVTSYLNDWQPIPLTDEEGVPMHGVVGLRILLFVLTVVTMSMIWRQRRVTRLIGFVLCGLYLIFIAYAVLGSLDWIPV